MEEHVQLQQESAHVQIILTAHIANIYIAHIHLLLLIVIIMDGVIYILEYAIVMKDIMDIIVIRNYV